MLFTTSRWAIALGTLVAGVGLSVWTPGFAQQAAVETKPPEEQIKELIVQLSDDSYTVRQAAAERLLEVGLDAREQLQAVADGPDPETRAAASRLLTLIEKSEFKRRLDAFAADTDGRQGLTMPGWEPFRKLIGDDEIGRAMFVEMQRHEAALLADIFGNRASQPERRWEERLQKLVSWQASPINRNAAPPLGSCATVLFLGCLPELNVSDRIAAYQVHLVQRPPVVEAIKPGSTREGIRRVVVAWILNCPNRNEQLLDQRLTLARAQDIKEAAPLALQIAGAGPEFLTVSPGLRARAILTVGQLGTPDMADELEPLLDDTTIYGQLAPAHPVPAITIQIRDVALIAMLHLTDQSPIDYGFTDIRRTGARHDELTILGLPNDESRASAAAKWRAWKEARTTDASKGPPIPAEKAADR